MNKKKKAMCDVVYCCLCRKGIETRCRSRSVRSIRTIGSWGGSDLEMVLQYNVEQGATTSCGSLHYCELCISRSAWLKDLPWEDISDSHSYMTLFERLLFEGGHPNDREKVTTILREYDSTEEAIESYLPWNLYSHRIHRGDEKAEVMNRWLCYVKFVAGKELERREKCGEGLSSRSPPSLMCLCAEAVVARPELVLDCVRLCIKEEGVWRKLFFASKRLAERRMSITDIASIKRETEDVKFMYCTLGNIFKRFPPRATNNESFTPVYKSLRSLKDDSEEQYPLKENEKRVWQYKKYLLGTR